MPDSIRYNQPHVQERLARDYVAGVLSPAAHRRCEQLRAKLPELDKRIRQWEEQMQPLADQVPPLAPSPQVWTQIQASVNASSLRPATETQPAHWWNRLPFVRGFALASSFLLLVLAGLHFNEAPPAALDYVAVLTTANGDAQFVATASETTKVLELSNVGEALPTGSTYQLWALSRTDGETRSLGIIDTAALPPQALSESSWRLIADAQELLITLEMPGGSPIGEPSEDIVSRGLCVRLKAG